MSDQKSRQGEKSAGGLGEVAAAGAHEIPTGADAHPKRPPGAIRRLRRTVANRVLLVQLVGDASGGWTEIGRAPHDLRIAAGQAGDVAQCEIGRASWRESV